MKHRLEIALTVLTCLTAPAAAATKVHIMAMSRLDGTPIEATIVRRNGDATPTPVSPPIGPSGYVDLSETNCDFSTTYNVSPKNDLLYLDDPTHWEPCAGPEPLKFAFTPTGAFAEIAPILSGNFPTSWKASANVKVLTSLVDAAADKSDYGTVATLASHYSALADREGSPKVADAFRVLALQAGAVGAAKSTGAPLSADVLVLDPDQSRYVLSNSSLEAIKDFQSANKIYADGKLDWPTMTALPGGYAISPGELESKLRTYQME